MRKQATIVITQSMRLPIRVITTSLGRTPAATSVPASRADRWDTSPKVSSVRFPAREIATIARREGSAASTTSAAKFTCGSCPTAAAGGPGLGFAAAGNKTYPRRLVCEKAPQDAQTSLHLPRPGGFFGDLVELRPRNVLTSRHAESAFTRSGGTKGGASHWGQSPHGDAQALSARARQLTPQADERECHTVFDTFFCARLR